MENDELRLKATLITATLLIAAWMAYSETGIKITLPTNEYSSFGQWPEKNTPTAAACETPEQIDCSDESCEVFHPYDIKTNPSNPSGSYTCDKTLECSENCKVTSWTDCASWSGCCTYKVKCGEITDKTICEELGCKYTG
jgi:hypothetical protein